MKVDNSNTSKTSSIATQLLIAGTAACLADVATFPFDTAKVRLQLQGESTVLINRKMGSNNVENLLKIQTKRPLTTAIPTNIFRPTSRGFISTNAFPVPLPTHEIPAQIEKISKPNLQYRGLFGTIATIARQEGAVALYNGLSAGKLKQSDWDFFLFLFIIEWSISIFVLGMIVTKEKKNISKRVEQENLTFRNAP